MENNYLSRLFNFANQVFTPRSERVELAETKSSSKTDQFNEVGVKGEQLVRSFENEEIRQDNLKITDYRRMLDNDGQVQMLVNAIFNTILSAGVKICDDSDYDSEEDSVESEFIESNLLNPSWKGGMDLSMELTNRYFLRAYIEGYRVFEVVYKLDEEGKIRLKKLAPRAGNDDFEFKILTDDNGNFFGFRQKTNFAGKMIDVKVINDGSFKKALLVAYGQEFGSLYGRSGLRAAWYHYDKAHKGLFLNHVGQELGIINPRLIYTKGSTTPENRSAIINAFDKIHVESTIMLPEESFKVEFPTVTNSEVMREGREMINLHYSQLSKSILAQFIDLGSNVSSTGSRSLGESQIEFFKQGLQTIAKTLIEDPWNEIIADLIKINFNTNVYPTLKVNPISDKKANVLYQMLVELTKGGSIPQVLKDKIFHETSEELGIEVSLEEIKQESLNKEEAILKQQEQVKQQEMEKEQIMKTNSEMKAKMESNSMKMGEILHKHMNFGDGTEPDFIDNEPVRPLYLDEQKVKFIDIKRKLEDTKMRTEFILSKKLQEDKDKIINQYVLAMREGRKKINDVEIELADTQNTYREEIKQVANEVYEFGKRMASNEIGKSVPVTPKANSRAIEDRVDVVVDEQESKLALNLSGVANDSLDNSIPENDAKLLLEQEYDSFWGKVLVPAIGILISKTFNQGRALPFDKYSEDIFAFRYTAVLDARTTNYCRDLDGKVFQASDPNYALLTPPNHYGCRSFWTPILRGQESNNVEVNGKPMDIPIYSSVNTFKDV